MTLPDELSESAKALLARRAGLGARPGPAPRGAQGPAPLAVPQLGQWLLSEMFFSGAAGTLPRTLGFSGMLDRDALRSALAEIVRRHQVLRSGILVVDGEPFQTVREHATVDLREADLRGRPEAERRDAALALLDADARRPFDLTADVLMRPLLVRLGDRKYELQTTFHPVAFDGWSSGIFLRELGALYSAYSRGESSPLDELPLQYADFSVWERGREGSAELAAGRAFWKERVAGSSTALDLPADASRRLARSYEVGSASAIIPAPVVRRLSGVALEGETTLFAAAFAAFQVLVGRRAGLDDFVIGAVSANRAHRQTEGLIGSFMTVLPLRARLEGYPSFRTHLRRTSESLVQAFAHQDFPFQQLMSDLQPGATPGAATLFQVVFNYRSMPVALPEMTGLEVLEFRSRHLRATFDLLLNATPRNGELLLELEYDSGLFQPATAERWLQAYRTLLEAAAADPDASIADLPVMPEPERRLLAEEWSGAGRPVPRAELPVDRFLHRAATYPDGTAVEQGEIRLSYGELEARMHRLAGHLTAAGAGAGDLVGVAAEKSPDTIALQLAIFSMGSVYVPLDPRMPRSRLDRMLTVAGIRLIVADGSGAAAVADRPEPVLLLPELVGTAPSADPPDRRALADQDPAYVIFTSGSTGAPKGVVVPQGALARYIAHVTDTHEMRPGDRMLHSFTPAFDAALKEVFLPLANGATIVLRPDRMLDSPEAFAATARGLGLSHVSMPTAVWHEIAAADWPEGLDLGVAARVVSFGGEAAGPAAVRRFHAATPEHLRLLNGYGPTECTIAATSAELARDEEYGDLVPIGRPFPGVRVYVLDARGHAVPIGVAGELWIGGANLALHYLGAPELTAERFLGPAESPVPGERLYRTGDRVLWRHDGQLAYLGRTDFQIKLRGYRVELGEIERVLCGLPGVRRAVVITHPAAPDRLVAFVVPAPRAVLEPHLVREGAAQELPEYMVPGAIVPLARLPLTPTGKVDRRALGLLVPAPSDATAGSLVTLTEQAVARIWEDLLQVERVGRHHRFLELGGHSLLAMRMVARIRQDLGQAISIRFVLEHPSLESLAGELDRLMGSPAGEPAEEHISRVSREAVKRQRPRRASDG